MSRLEFRAAVEAPRPASAWVMVAVASATLWITGQLSPWVLALQPVALVASLALRRRPLRWQQSPAVLNTLLAAVLLATGFIASRRFPSTIALAHFASLTQALQLFDVRPRRSEFLLVVLALFQVVLASTLTDSVFFPPLLVAFVFSATWTLMVHTLRTEAQEAGDPSEAARALTPALGRLTALAGTLSLGVALVLFVVLPRMRSSVLHVGGLGGPLSISGFSDRVELGRNGRIRGDPTVALRVETLEGQAPEPIDAYWRGLAFDDFDGRHWSITPGLRTPVIGSPEVGVRLGRDGGEGNLVQRIVREPVDAGVVFAAGRPVSIQGTPRRLERDVNGGLYAPLQPDERLRYTVRSTLAPPTDAVLAKDHTARPRVRGDRYLELPRLDPAVGALARRIVADAPSDAARARALEAWLRSNGRYSDTPPRIDPKDPRSPVEIFLLGGIEGHCEYFASAMVVLARSLGIPARLVNGFAGGRENRIGGFVELTGADAHAWVEIHYARAGWVRYDPTPPGPRLRAATDLSLREQLAELGSALELWWFQRVVGFDRSDQMRALRSAWLAWRGARRGASEASDETPRHTILDWRPPGLDALPWRTLAGALALALATGAALRAGPRSERTRDRVPAAYRRALRWLARRGLERAPGATARAFAAQVAAARPAAAAPFSALTESYLRARFGHAAVAEQDWSAALAELRAALRSEQSEGSPPA